MRVPVFVMIRPRGGDFLYSDREVEVMKADIRLAKLHGADGLVFGALTEDGRIDTELCTALLGEGPLGKAPCWVRLVALLRLMPYICTEGFALRIPSAVLPSLSTFFGFVSCHTSETLSSLETLQTEGHSPKPFTQGVRLPGT